MDLYYTGQGFQDCFEIGNREKRTQRRKNIMISSTLIVE